MRVSGSSSSVFCAFGTTSKNEIGSKVIVALSRAACPQGLWGLECSRPCDCNDRGTCLPVDGSCDCDPGWTGVQCGYGNFSL